MATKHLCSTTYSLIDGTKVFARCGAQGLTQADIQHWSWEWWSDPDTCPGCRASLEWEAKQIDTRREGT